MVLIRSAMTPTCASPSKPISTAGHLHFPAGLRCFQKLDEIPAIAALFEGKRQFQQLVGIDEPLRKGDLLEAGHFHPLPRLKRLDEPGGIDEGAECPGIEPGKPPPQLHNV